MSRSGGITTSRQLDVIQRPGETATKDIRGLVASPSCFGHHYAKTADECKRCLCPVVLDGRVYVTHEVCRAITRGDLDPEAITLNRLTSQEVAERLSQGKTMYDMWTEILDGTSPDVAGAEARSLLRQRLTYLHQKGVVAEPDVPPTSELRERFAADG